MQTHFCVKSMHNFAIVSKRDHLLFQCLSFSFFIPIQRFRLFYEVVIDIFAIQELLCRSLKRGTNAVLLPFLGGSANNYRIRIAVKWEAHRTENCPG